MPAKTVKELIALMKANPGKYPIANSGLGTTPMLASELFKLTYKLDVTTVPYNGGAPVIQAVVGNQTPIGFATLPPAYPQLVAGTLRALAVTSAKRAEALPDVPTMAEAGIADQESDTMQGIFVPAGTPPEIVALLNREIVAALKLPDVKAKCKQIGFDVVGDTPDRVFRLPQETDRQVAQGHRRRQDPADSNNGALRYTSCASDPKQSRQ